MAYIDQSDFSSYTITEIPETEFNVLAERASDVIDLLTFNRVTADGGLTEMTDAEQAAIKKAVCAEVEYLYNEGGILAATGNATDTGVSLGKFSISAPAAPSAPKLGGIPVSPLARGYLMHQGLTYRGIP